MISRNEDQPATRADLSAAVAVLKSDLKSDIAGVRTELKSDIADVRTELKSDIADVRTELKSDISRLDKKIDRVAVEVVKTNVRMDDMHQSLSRKIDDGNNRIMTTLDAFVKKVEADNRAIVIHSQVLIEHSEKLKDHGRRLTVLEPRV